MRSEFSKWLNKYNNEICCNECAKDVWMACLEWVVKELDLRYPDRDLQCTCYAELMQLMHDELILLSKNESN